MVRYGIFLAVVLAPIVASAEERDPWIGKLVVLKPSAVLLKDNAPVDIRFLKVPATVFDADQNRVFLGRGWVKKVDVLDPDQAIEFCDEQLKVNPNDAKAWQLRGLAWMGKKENQKAIDCLDEALRLDSTFSEAAFYRAHIRACMYLDSKEYVPAIHLDPTNPLPYLCRGFLLLGRGAVEEAILDCNRAVDVDPECHEAFRLRGDIAMMQRDYEAAKKDYGEAIKHNPRNAGTFHNRAVAWIEERNSDKATQDIKEAMRIEPLEASHYNLRSCCWIVERKYEKAIADLSESIRLQPYHSKPYGLKGDAHQLLEQYQEAIEDYKACASLDREDAHPVLGIAMIYAACPDAEIRDGKKALEYALRAFSMANVEQESTLSVLAAAYAETGDWKNAIRFQKEAIEKAPESSKQVRKTTLQLYENREPLRVTREELEKGQRFSLFFSL